MSYVQRPTTWHLVLMSGVVSLLGVGADSAIVGAQQGAQTTRVVVTPVEGPSTLRRLGLTIEQSSIGSAS